MKVGDPLSLVSNKSTNQRADENPILGFKKLIKGNKNGKCKT